MRHSSTYRFLLAPLAAALLFAACSGSKSFAKKGAKLDQAGLYTEAAEMYYQSLVRNGRNVDAKIGLKKTGQQVLNDKLSQFFKTVSMEGDKGGAVDAYLEAKEYADRVQRLGVTLEIPDHYRTDFNDVKGKYLVELYEKGQQLMTQQDFKGAEQVFARIAKLEPEYKDASSLQTVAYVEPLYRSGKEALAAGQYRKAYGDLNKVTEKDPTYKDAAALKQEAVAKGQYTIGVLPFGSATARKDVAPRAQAYAISALTEVNDPFLKVVDRENIERILEEQRLGLSGVVDEQTAVRVGNLMGAQAMLMGTVLDYREEAGALKRSTKDGFEAYRVRQLNPETNEYVTVTKYKPVKYMEYYQENKVVLSFSYKLVSQETGQVLFSKVIDRTADDHIYYANYDGNKEMLLPMRNGAVDTNDRSRRDLQGLLTASRELKPIAGLGNDLVRTTCGSMASTLQQELATILP